MTIHFGLDFGTSNSALSVNINGKVTLLDIDPYNTSGTTLKSILYFDEYEKNIYTGELAVTKYIDNDAEGRYMQSIKSFMSDQSFTGTEINREFYQIEDLVALVLKRIKAVGEKHINRQVDSVVLGRPVIFHDNPVKDKLAEERLVNAAKKAGFKTIRLVMEPIAAALSYQKSLHTGAEKKIIVGDFGGGTSDFTVMKINNKQESDLDRQSEILSVHGIPTGGNTFDSLIMWEKISTYYGRGLKIKGYMSENFFEIPGNIISKLKRWHLIPQLRAYRIQELIKELKYRSNNHPYVKNLSNLIDDNYGYMLFRTIEEAKCNLSSFETADINLTEYINQTTELSRTEFKEIIKDEVEKINTCIEEALLKASVETSEIDTVFLTGGSSYIPCIKELFIDKFCEHKVKHSDAFTSVAFGLGLSGMSE